METTSFAHIPDVNQGASMSYTRNGTRNDSSFVFKCKHIRFPSDNSPEFILRIAGYQSPC